ALDRFVDHRHECVHTLDREPLHVHEGETEKPLEAVDLREPPQHASLLLRRERRSNASLFYRASEPVPFRLFLEMIELEADRPAVQLTQMLHDVSGGTRELCACVTVVQGGRLDVLHVAPG